MTQSIIFRFPAPSQAPGMVKINSNIEYNKLDVTWNHVPDQHLNGELIGYKIRLSLLKIGGIPVLTGQTEEKFIHPFLNKFTLSGLKPNAQYSVTLLAFNKFEDGVSSSSIIGGKSNSHGKCKTQVGRLINVGVRVGNTRVSGWFRNSFQHHAFE